MARENRTPRLSGGRWPAPGQLCAPPPTRRIALWNVLERASRPFQLVLVNPQHVRALPGRKTDQKDCERLAELGQYDPLRSSFIPPPPIRELRDLTRWRTHLQQDRNRLINRIGRLLETANIKLSSAATDIVGTGSFAIQEG